MLNRSESIKEITKSLLEFQSNVTGIKKDGQGYNYQYITLDQILALVRPALTKVGIVMNQYLGHIVVDNQILTSVETVLMHSSGEWISSGSIPIYPTNNPKMSIPQNLGSAITYEKRYQISALLGLSSDVDDDAAIISSNANNWGQGHKISPAQVQTITVLMTKNNISKEDIQNLTIELFGEARSASQLNQTEASKVIERLSKMPHQGQSNTAPNNPENDKAKNEESQNNTFEEPAF